MNHPTRRRIPSFSTTETGQTMAEYSVLVAVVALTVLAVLPQLAAPIRGFFDAAAQVFGS